MLSLTYCGIDAQGADALFEIMIYSRSALEEVNLSGNLLMNEGIIKLLRGVAIAKSLKKILVADNQFNDDEDVMKALEFCMKKNDRLGKYDLKYNNIGEQGKSTGTGLESHPSLKIIQISANSGDPRAVLAKFFIAAVNLIFQLTRCRCPLGRSL